MLSNHMSRHGPSQTTSCVQPVLGLEPTNFRSKHLNREVCCAVLKVRATGKTTTTQHNTTAQLHNCNSAQLHNNNRQQTTNNKQHTTYNNNNPIWGGSVLTGEEPPPHTKKLNHALSQVGGPTQPKPSCSALCRQDTTSP